MGTSLTLLGLGTPQMALALFTQWRNGSDPKGTENPIVKILVRLFNDNYASDDEEGFGDY